MLADFFSILLGLLPRRVSIQQGTLRRGFLSPPILSWSASHRDTPFSLPAASFTRSICWTPFVKVSAHCFLFGWAADCAWADERGQAGAHRLPINRPVIP